jgi:predicted PhzF superfamily epimerase YddE/YHI9
VCLQEALDDPTFGSLPAATRSGFAGFFFPLRKPPLGMGRQPTIRQQGSQLETLGVSARYVGVNRFDYFVEVQSEEVVRRMTPDLVRLGRIEARGVIVTGRSGAPEYDFVSRFFCPAGGDR